MVSIASSSHRFTHLSDGATRSQYCGFYNPMELLEGVESNSTSLALLKYLSDDIFQRPCCIQGAYLAQPIEEV